MAEFLPLLLFLVICLVLMLGYPVALTLAGVSLLFAFVGELTGHFDMAFLQALPNRLYGTIDNSTLVAVPMFILMGVMLEKSRIAEELLTGMAQLLRRTYGGLAIAVVLIGSLLAASTGIIGATVVTMGLISLPVMLRAGYDTRLATGTICATGTLGQIIPPSIVLVLLGDILSTAYQQAQLSQGIFTPRTVSVGDLFLGAIGPSIALVLAYLAYLLVIARVKRHWAPLPSERMEDEVPIPPARLVLALVPPVALILIVLGSILTGVATPTEAASLGALGATLLALGRGQLGWRQLRDTVESVTRITAMVFLILIGAAVFSLVFRGFGGEELVHELFHNLPGGVITATLIVMLVIFLLGFILDFIEIAFVVVPIVAPVLLAMGLDPVWLGVMIAINLQTSFLTPPFGFALFYLRGVAPPEIATTDLYRGVIPFIIIQLLLLLVLAFWPQLATWLPAHLLSY